MSSNESNLNNVIYRLRFILSYFSRLRRDYDEELRKAKDAVSEQSLNFERKLKQNEEKWATKMKQITEEHNAKVSKQF